MPLSMYQIFCELLIPCLLIFSIFLTSKLLHNLKDHLHLTVNRRLYILRNFTTCSALFYFLNRTCFQHYLYVFHNLLRFLPKNIFNFKNNNKRVTPISAGPSCAVYLYYNFTPGLAKKNCFKSQIV